MELKKNPKADLEKRKGFYLEIGFVVALVIVLLAFNWKSYEFSEVDVNKRDFTEDMMEEVENTEQEEEPEPPQEQPQEQQVIEELVIVEDDVKVDDIIIDAEDNADKQQVEIAPVEIVEEQVTVEEVIFQVVEDEPEFPGGMEALYKYLGESIKYPALAKENNIEGRVYVTFVVEKDGSIANPRILRDIGGGCGQEAIRGVKAMPKWKPGKQRGKNVRVQFNLPVSFKLN